MMCDWKNGIAEVTYARDAKDFFADFSRYFTHVGFEELLLSRNRLILHAALIDSPYGGILFSGVSGVGKSTQANLWKTFEGCMVINGDRPILHHSENGWLAWGSPYAGSSECYVNRSVPVAAVIMLEQGDCNEIHRLDPAASFRKLYAQTTVNSWNKEYVSRVCELLTDFAANIPVYNMVCTPDRMAVEIVKQELRRLGSADPTG